VNNSMLPEIKESFTASFDGQQLADHFGARNRIRCRTSRSRQMTRGKWNAFMPFLVRPPRGES